MVAPIGDKSVKVQIEDLKTGDEGIWITKKQFQKLKSQMVKKLDKKDQEIRKILIFGLVGCFLLAVLVSGMFYCQIKSSQEYDKLSYHCTDLEEQVKKEKLEHHMEAPKKCNTGWNAMEVGFISRNAIIERGATVEPGAFVFPKAIIRSGAVVRTGALIHYKAEVGNGAMVDSNATIAAGTIIGNDVMVGNKAFIAPFAKIGEKALIGSKAYVGSKVSVNGGQKVESGSITLNVPKYGYLAPQDVDRFRDSHEFYLNIRRKVLIGSYFWFPNIDEYEVFVRIYLIA